MKLPNAIRGGRQSFAPAVSEAPAIMAEGKAVVAGLDMAAEQFDKYVASEDKADELDANMKSGEEVNALRIELAKKDTFLRENLSAEVLKAAGLEDGTDEIIPAYKVRSHVFKEKADVIVGNAARGIRNNNIGNSWYAQASTNINNEFTEQKLAEIAEQKGYQRAKGIEHANNAVDVGNFAVAREIIRTTQPKNKQAEKIETINTAEEQFGISGLIQGISDPETWKVAEEEVKRLRDPKEESYLTTEERIKQANRIEAAMGGAKTKAKSDIKVKAFDIIEPAIVSIIIDGKYNPDISEKLKELVKNDVITLEYASRVNTKNASNKAYAIKKEKVKEERGSGYLDADNKVHQGIADDEYEVLVKTINTETGEYYTPELAADYMIKSRGIIPTKVKDAIYVSNNKMGNETSPQDFIAAAEFLNEVEVKGRNIYNQFDENKVKDLRKYNTYTKSGYTPKEAFKLIEAVNAQTPQDIKNIKELTKDSGSLSLESTTNYLKDEMDTFIEGSIIPYFGEGRLQITPVMEQQYNALVIDSMSLFGGDVELAKVYAMTKMANIYSENTINNYNDTGIDRRTLMPYIDAAHTKLIVADLNKKIKGAKDSAGVALLEAVNYSNPKLIETNQTHVDAIARGVATFRISYEDENGEVQLLPDIFEYPITKEGKAKWLKTTGDERRADKEIERQEQKAIDALDFDAAP